MSLTASESTNDSGWAIRGDYWLKKLNPVPQYKARKRRIIHKPLVLSGHGIRMNIEYNTLVISCGFTHYPQTREQYRFFPRDRQLPSRIVILDGDGSITFGALQWLAAQNVPLVQINWRGELANIGYADYSAEPDLVQHQWEMKHSKQGFEFAQWLILRKIENSYTVLKTVSQNAEAAELILEKIRAQATILKASPPPDLISLLAIEGIAAAAYFRYWYTLSLKWRGINKKPVPPEWLRIGTRIGRNDSNQFAMHPVNAILNYAYAVLESQVLGQVVAKAIDPTIGFIHSNGNKRHSLVFDLMEPVRPVIDKKVLEFVLSRSFSPDDFILTNGGVCRLHPQLARMVVKLVQDIPEVTTTTEGNIKKMFSGKASFRKTTSLKLNI